MLSVIHTVVRISQYCHGAFSRRECYQEETILRLTFFSSTTNTIELKLLVLQTHSVRGLQRTPLKQTALFSSKEGVLPGSRLRVEQQRRRQVAVQGHPKACLQEMTSDRKELPGVCRRTTWGEIPHWTRCAEKDHFFVCVGRMSNGHGRNRVDSVWKFCKTDCPPWVFQSLF